MPTWNVIGVARAPAGNGVFTRGRILAALYLFVIFAGITAQGLEALSLAFIKINNQGAAIALIFFWFETLIRGWLLFKSEFLPRFLGVLSMVGGLGWLTFLWPPLGSQAFMGVALFAIAGVIATTGWLFIRGVDDVKWRTRAALATTSIWR